MTLVEQHIIKSNNIFYKELDNLCFLSKNLYNQALYRIRQQFFEDKSFKNYYEVNKELHDENQVDYRALPANSSQETLKLVNQNYSSFFKSLQKHIKGVKIPRYLDKTKGRQIVVYNHMTLPSGLLEKGIIKLPKSNLQFKTKQKNIRQVRIVPKNNYIVLEVVYEATIKELLKDNKRYMSIDLGIDNLASCSSNVTKSFIINGKSVKSINQYYNKKKSEMQSELKKVNGNDWSKGLQKLTDKRYEKIKNYMHCVSKYIIDYCVLYDVDTLVIGHNNGWKQNTKNMQNFTYIPYELFFKILKYKCENNGIKYNVIEESYTSGTSFLDSEIPCKENYNKDRRIQRGLFISNNNIKINADINAAYQIMKKAFPNVFSDGIEGVGLHPLIVNVTS